MPLFGFVGFTFSIWVASWIFAWLLHAGRGSLLVVVFFHAWWASSSYARCFISRAEEARR